MWHCLVNTRKIISRGKENWNISKNWSLGKVTCLLCYYTFPISYIYVQSYYMLKVNSAKPSDKYLFEIVNKSIKDCCQICFVKKVNWSELRPKKVVFFPEIVRVKIFSSLTRTHGRMCIRIYIFCFKRKKQCVESLMRYDNIVWKFALCTFDPSSANPTKWSNTLKQFVGNLRLFDDFVKLALKGLT